MPWGAIIGGVLGAVANSGSDSQTVQNSVPPEFSGLAGAVADRGMQIGNMPYQPYPYSMVADFNPYQFMGMDMGANRAMTSGLPQQAENTLQKTLAGGYFSPQGSNQYMGAKNPYSGSNPYLDNAIDSTLGDITKQFNTQVAPSMAATALQSGSFGNTGFQEAENNQRDQLAKTLGNVSSNMRMQDYTTQQGLGESALNRNSSLAEGQLNRSMSAWDSERNRMMGGLGMAGNINALGYQPGEYLQGIGGTQQQQGQNVLNSWYQQFQESQNWPFKTYDAMMAPFGRNIGSQSTTSGPAGNPVSGLMGGAMMGSRMGGWFGGGNGGGNNPPSTPYDYFPSGVEY